jgi:hypothetical protein
MQTHGGLADQYAEEGQQPQYGRQQQYQPPPSKQQYLPQPSMYSPEPVTSANGEKIDFNQTFCVVKPRHNDIRAVLVFIATFAGFL